MYVCLCKAITDSQIKQAADEGDGSFRAVRESLGVATVCGSCACEAKKLVKASARSSTEDQLLYQPA
ncbi:(2Fe-2S)-binding protein [Agaribacterium sp. ZY112]|uniref:(2Fe-2S)-binding protein n=1 Tax=Agaribacterium sp. ZY112 TaxID=3233574 RepID=UPI003524F25B